MEIKERGDGPVMPLNTPAPSSQVPRLLRHPAVHPRMTWMDALLQKESTGLFSQSSDVGQDW